MTIPISALVQPGTSNDYLAAMLAAATTIGLQTTAWQEGDPSLTILEIMADVMAARDANVETSFVSAGLLDFAAQPSVTPEPVRGVVYVPGWLDMTADQLFDTQRQTSTYATCAVTFTNSTGAAITCPPRSYHVSDATGASTFSNVDTLTIPTGASGPFQLTADVIGAGQLVPTTAVVQVPLLTPAFSAFVNGLDDESNTSLVSRCRDRFQTLSHGGPAGAYSYFARTIPTESPAVVLSGLRSVPLAPVTKVLVAAVTGGPISNPDVTMYAANAAGAYTAKDTHTDSVALNVSNAVNHTTYVTITTSLAHGYSTGDTVYLHGIGGFAGLDNTATNPTYAISSVTTYGFDVTVAATGSFTSGGTAYRVSDLDLVKRNLIQYCVPEGILVGLSTATADNVPIAYYLTVRAAGATQALIAKINAAITAYIASIPIGGYAVTGGNGIPFGVVLGTVWAQDPINIVSVHVKINGVLDTDYVMSAATSVAGITGSIAPALVTESTYVTVTA